MGKLQIIEGIPSLDSKIVLTILRKYLLDHIRLETQSDIDLNPSSGIHCSSLFSFNFDIMSFSKLVYFILTSPRLCTYYTNLGLIKTINVIYIKVNY